MKQYIVPLAFLIIWSLEHFYPYYKDQSINLKHDVRNLFWGVIAVGISSLAIFFLPNNPQKIPTLAAIFFIDFLMYWWHRANHEIPLLWMWHRPHHTDKKMNSTTAVRFHPVEISLSTILRIAALTLLPITLTQLLTYEAFLLPAIIFHHSNINLPKPLDKLLSKLIITPNLHRVHHSTNIKQRNENYGSIFTFWDYAFRTRNTDNPKTVKLGIKNYEDNSLQDMLLAFK